MLVICDQLIIAHHLIISNILKLPLLSGLSNIVASAKEWWRSPVDSGSVSASLRRNSEDCRVFTALKSLSAGTHWDTHSTQQVVRTARVKSYHIKSLPSKGSSTDKKDRLNKSRASFTPISFMPPHSKKISPFGQELGGFEGSRQFTTGKPSHARQEDGNNMQPLSHVSFVEMGISAPCA